ncbi:MAG: tetratricopeptide repeat protein, partial [Bacteroidetes bacterium]|nr:tetratricopeptide repeat protein [Bacteroidota bacterium]
MNRSSRPSAAVERNTEVRGFGFLVLVLSAFLICVGVPVSQAQTGEPEEIFREAVELYKQADYTGTIELLEELQRNGYGSFPVHYNLGNAYYKNGELAKSILHYERALLHDPGNEDVLHNLKVVRARARDRLEPVPLLFFVRWWNDIKDAVTAETLFILSVLLLWILAAALFVFFGYRRILIRRIALVI